MTRTLTLIVFGFRKSEIHAWLHRHHHLGLEAVRLVCAYHLDDVASDPVAEAICTMFQGLHCGFARIQQCFSFVDTPHVLLAAGDDQILSIPPDVVERLPSSVAVAGNVFFQADSHARPSSNNSILFNGSPLEVLQRYWSLPNPGDNCLFYSIFPTDRFKEIFATAGGYEGSDYYVVHRFLLACTFSRNPSFVIVRQPPPLTNHYTRRFLDRLSHARLNKKAWPFHNPLLRAFRNIYEATPAHMVSLLQPCWATWLLLKYDEMARADTGYRDLIKRVDLAQLSSEMASNLGTLAESQLPPPC